MGDHIPSIPNEPRPSDTNHFTHFKMLSDKKTKAIFSALENAMLVAHSFKNGTNNVLEFNLWEDLTESCSKTIKFLKKGRHDVTEMAGSFSTIKFFIKELLKLNTKSNWFLLQPHELGNVLELFNLVCSI